MDEGGRSADGQGAWPGRELAGLSDDELTRGYDEAVAGVRRAQWLRLALASEVERRSMWRTDGVRSLRDWVCMRNGEGDRTASREARTAKELPGHPLLAAALEGGGLSEDHVRLLLVLAGRAGLDDEELVALGERHTVPQLETACRSARRLGRAEDREGHDRRFVRWWCDDDGTFHLRGRLHGEDGAIVTDMLSSMAEDAEPDPATGLCDPYDARCADALVERCRGPEGSVTERPTVVIHAPLAALDPAGEDGVPTTWDGTPIGNDALRRLLCDTRLRVTVDAPDGRAVGIGRRSRVIPAWLLGQLRFRDRGCRFPGCGRTRWLHGHHLCHWADGGPTDLSNLAQLCGPHHRAVHEGEWRVSGSPDGELAFEGPTGQRFTSRPAILLGPCDRRNDGRSHRRDRRGRFPDDRPRGPVAPGAP